MTYLRPRWPRPAITLAVAGLILMPALVFLAARLLLPGDGTKVILAAPYTHTDGLVVVPRIVSSTGLQADDIVLALADRPLAAWLHAATVGEWSFRTEAPAELPYLVARDGQTQRLTVRLAPFPLLAALVNDWSMFVFLLYMLLVSFSVFLRRWRLPAAHVFLLLSSILFANGVVFNLGLQTSDLLSPWIVALWLGETVIMDLVLMAVILHFALVFPRRHPLVRSHPAVLIPVYLGTWLVYGSFVAVRWTMAPTATRRLLLLVQATTPMMAVYFVLVLLVWVSSYRTSRASVERRQIRWIVWGMSVGVVPFILLSLLPSAVFDAPVGTNFGPVGLFLCAIPTAAMIAILRERLFDIDVLINRTLVYGTLTATLGAIYAGSVVLLQALVSPWLHTSSQVELVVSTLTIAMLFHPLRGRLQTMIDRRFYRAKYDAAKTLDALAVRLRDDVDLDTLSADLLGVVGEIMQPAHASLWLREPPRFLHSDEDAFPEREGAEALRVEVTRGAAR